MTDNIISSLKMKGKLFMLCNKFPLIFDNSYWFLLITSMDIMIDYITWKLRPLLQSTF